MMLGRVIAHLGVGPPTGDPFGTPTEVFGEREALDLCADGVAEGALPGVVVARLLPRVADIRRLGSASLDLCAVAAGRLDAYFEAGLQVWDYAAGVLIATEAGCAASGLRSRPPSSNLTAVTGKSLAVEFFALLEELGADAVSSSSS